MKRLKRIGEMSGNHPHRHSTQWAADDFREMIAIEGPPPLYEETTQRLRNYKNIEFLLGDSRERLPDVGAKLERS